MITVRAEALTSTGRRVALVTPVVQALYEDVPTFKALVLGILVETAAREGEEVMPETLAYYQLTPLEEMES